MDDYTRTETNRWHKRLIGRRAPKHRSPHLQAPNDLEEIGHAGETADNAGSPDDVRAHDRLGDEASGQLDQERGVSGAAAALLAGGFACALFGVIVFAAEVSESLAERLTLSEAVGPLSGKTVAPIVGWVAAWMLLHLHMRARRVNLGRSVRVALGLTAIGFVGTFPPVWKLFAQ